MSRPESRTPSQRTEKGWSITGVYGLYYSSFSPTRREAIVQHIGCKGCDWKVCYGRGDRVVKTVLRVVK